MQVMTRFEGSIEDTNHEEKWTKRHQIANTIILSTISVILLAYIIGKATHTHQLTQNL